MLLLTSSLQSVLLYHLKPSATLMIIIGDSADIQQRLAFNSQMIVLRFQKIVQIFFRAAFSGFVIAQH